MAIYFQLPTNQQPKIITPNTLWNQKIESEWMTREEVCSYLFISIRSLQQYKSEGRLKPIKVNGRVFYNRADVKRFQRVYLKERNLKQI